MVDRQVIVSGYELRGERITVGHTTGVLDSQNVKAGRALGNCLRQIPQHRDEGFEAQTEMWHPAAWSPSCSSPYPVLFSLQFFPLSLGLQTIFIIRVFMYFHSDEIGCCLFYR